MNMKTNTTERDLLNGFMDSIGIRGKFIATITRADGTIERQETENVVTAAGLNHLASRAIADTGSKYGWLAIGSATHTPHINSQYIAESSRKAAAVIGSSKEVLYVVATWGGAADSVTSVAIAGCAIANHGTSGSGHYLNHAAVSVVLADSDFLHLEAQVSVGSHAI